MHNLEVEVVDLKRKANKSNTHVYFMKNSIILDEILDSQISPNVKYCIGYNKEVAYFEVGASKKKYVGHSFSKGEIKVSHQAPAKRKESSGRSEQGRHQEASYTPQTKFRRERPSRLTQNHRYENAFNGNCFSCNQYGHKALDCRHYVWEDVGRFNNILRCWRCNLVGHIAAHCHTMICYNYNGFGQKS
jgi:hypothetical protein